MIRTLIVEDEHLIQETIAEIIQNHCEDIELIGLCGDVASATIMIKKTKPDLVLFDVDLPDGTSFDILEQLDLVDFKIIFITAFEEYALKAIKLSALDYLVKPIDPKELIEAINKAKDTIQKSNNDLKLNALLANIKSISEKSKKIVLKTAESIYLIDIQDIVRCESDGAYTLFYLGDGKKIMISKGLKDYEDLLCEYSFMRVHKSHIVNLNYIDHFEKQDGGSLLLKDQSSIPVSFRKKEQLIKLFEHLSQL
ncbi:MAG: LytTR family DNA-binding domain-containing protein [Bacteroidales bacterium]|jgi:two-component system LytT family response regulator|nr:LytTR family DNA-binding domain-containing protein [Bacteroidales bacterium]